MCDPRCPRAPVRIPGRGVVSLIPVGRRAEGEGEGGVSHRRQRPLGVGGRISCVGGFPPGGRGPEGVAKSGPPCTHRNEKEKKRETKTRAHRRNGVRDPDGVFLEQWSRFRKPRPRSFATANRELNLANGRRSPDRLALEVLS